MMILAIVGSLRKKSYNMQLAKTMQERYKDKFTMKIADIGSLPYFNEDEENDPPQIVKNFKKDIADSDGVFIFTPEYNWSIPGVLKNALDWTSRGDKVLIDKPVMIFGVTTGMLGTVRAQMHLREILSSSGVQARIFPTGGNEILINYASHKFDEETGRMVDEYTLKFLDDKINKFIEFIG